ncbi:MAG: cytochrome c [Myxococcaceae bacterium]
MRPLLLTVVVLSLSPAFADEKVPKKEPKPVAAKSEKQPALSELARQLLRRRMERHGRDLNQLATGVVLLRREVVLAIAQTISTEPRITRPLPDTRDELNGALPERFFVLQDEVRERAKALAEAARSRDDAAVAEAYSRTIQTCVACHVSFLSPTE